MDSIDLYFLISLLVVAILMGSFIIDTGFFEPAAAEIAKQECVARGFDYADDFRKIPFSTAPLGIKCKYAYNIEVIGGAKK